MTGPVVLDASAIVAALLRTPSPFGGDSLETVLADSTATLCAPSIVDVEVVSALRSALRRGVLTESRAESALDDYRRLPLRRFLQSPFLSRIFALRGFLTPYDASYVLLASALDASLYTADRRLARVVLDRELASVVEV